MGCSLAMRRMTKMLLMTISNDKWACSHLRRWYRYAKKYSKCELGVIYIGDDARMEAELKDAFDHVVNFNSNHDHRRFYNSVRLTAPALFDTPCVYCDCDADVWDSLDLTYPDVEVCCVKSPAEHSDWKQMGEGKAEYNNGFLVLRYDAARAEAIRSIYEARTQEVIDAGAHPRTAGTMAFNKMLHSQDVTWAELDYSHSVIWWDDMAFWDAKVIQWCNDKGQSHRLRLQSEWIKGRGLLDDNAILPR